MGTETDTDGWGQRQTAVTGDNAAAQAMHEESGSVSLRLSATEGDTLRHACRDLYL